MKKEIDNEVSSKKENTSKVENEINQETEANGKAEEDKTENPHPEKEETKSSDNKDKKAKELDELNDRYIRLCAEYDNYRKRSEKEKSESYQAGIISAVSLFVPLLDNLDRALSFEPENEGMKLICKQVMDIFKNLGIEEIETDGKTFDPLLHNAVMHEEDTEKGESLVSQTFQKGYTLNGKIIRHAVVKVVN